MAVIGLPVQVERSSANAWLGATVASAQPTDALASFPLMFVSIHMRYSPRRSRSEKKSREVYNEFLESKICGTGDLRNAKFPAEIRTSARLARIKVGNSFCSRQNRRAAPPVISCS